MCSDRTTQPPGLVEQMADICLAARVRVLSRAISALYDEAFRPHGVKISQINVLVAIRRMGRTRSADVAAALQMDASTVSRNIERLVARGWLKPVPAGDGRVRCLALTAAGEALLEEVAPAWAQAQQRAEALIGDQGAALIKGAADRLMAAAR